MPAWFAALGKAAGGAAGGAGGDGSKEADGRGKGPRPMLSPIQTGLGAMNRRAEDRAKAEAAAQAVNEATFSYEQDQRDIERNQDLTGELTGSLPTDYVTSGMLVPQDRTDLGGAAMENLLDMSSGYNPTMEFNPYLQLYGADKHAVQGLQDSAQGRREDTLGNYEDAVTDLSMEYSDAASRLGDRRDEQRETYQDRIQDDRDSQRVDEAKLIVETWMDSNDAGSAAGENRFLDRRGPRDSRGKVLGADEGAKRAWIDELLQLGYTYEDILQDEDFLKYFQGDSRAGTMFRSYASDPDYATRDERRPHQVLEGSDPTWGKLRGGF